ncbi:fimbria/pilus periplasmic chaperone [Lonsdalea quercina]|uniref:fimbria/pilus periplasmic chaperone n=1 Tax=Lonsdalea quercina TaxID=71657 RepID=UPI003975A0BF
MSLFSIKQTHLIKQKNNENDKSVYLSKNILGGVLISTTLLAFSPSSSAEGAKERQTIAATTKVFEIKLGANRLIYRPNSAGAEISVTNPQDYPILIQGKVYNEDKKTAAPFIVTPPLSRLEAKQQSRLRIIRTGGSIDNDKETLQWFCVGGIPPKGTDVWAQDKNGKSLAPSSIRLQVEVSAHLCIKMMTRPSDVKGSPMDGADALQWHQQGHQLSVTNPSPFYINLSSVSVGGKAVQNIEYVAPRASRTFHLPEGAGGQVSWKIITDEGGESHLFQAPLR